MADLPFFSLVAHEMRIRLDDGRGPEAMAMVLKELRAGTADVQVQVIAAELLEALPNRRKAKPGSAADASQAVKKSGRPRNDPEMWLEIGRAFEDKMSEGLTFEEAREAVAEEVKMSEGHVGKAVAFFRKAVACT